MTQFFERGPSREALQSQVMGKGIGGALGNFAGQQIRRGQLTKAFDQAKTAIGEGGNYLDAMGKLAPYMMSLPGGSELLSTLAPLISTNVENESIRKNLDKMSDQANNIDSMKVGADEAPEMEEKPKMVDVPGTKSMKVRADEPEKNKFNKKTEKSSKDSFYPQKTVEPNLQKPMTPQELNRFALDTVRGTGGKMPFQEAYKLANQQNEAIMGMNQKILQEQQMQKAAVEEMGKTFVTRAENSGLISPDNPEDKTIVEKFAYEARDEGTPPEQWEYIRTQKQRFDTARAGIRTAGDLAGPLANLWRKGVGTYKDIGEVQKSVQAPIKFYKEHGLIPELRDEISSSLGLGPEMTEETIYPFSPAQKKEIESFPKSPKEFSFGQKVKEKLGALGKIEKQFPGEEYRLGTEERNQFKDRLENILNDPENEDINMISLRGRLNQEKEYAWQDIAQSITELQNEGRWQPNYTQEQQIPIIMQAPLPGLAQQFEFLYKGKK